MATGDGEADGGAGTGAGSIAGSSGTWGASDDLNGKFNVSTRRKRDENLLTQPSSLRTA